MWQTTWEGKVLSADQAEGVGHVPDRACDPWSVLCLFWRGLFVSLLMQGTVSAEHTLALGSKGRYLEEEAGQELPWQGFEIMRLANFRKGSAVPSGQPARFAAASFSATVASANGPEALGFHSAAIQGDRPGVKS